MRHLVTKISSVFRIELAPSICVFWDFPDAVKWDKREIQEKSDESMTDKN